MKSMAFKNKLSNIILPVLKNWDFTPAFQGIKGKQKHASQPNHQIPSDLFCKNACVVNSSVRKIVGYWDI